MSRGKGDAGPRRRPGGPRGVRVYDVPRGQSAELPPRGTPLGGGLALSSDRATLRAVRQAVHDRVQHLEALSHVHRIVVAGLVVTFVSGVLLVLADVKTFWGSVIFWLKMALIAALLVNGFVMTRAEGSLRGEAVREDDRAWTHLYHTSWVSLVLWYTITLAGVALMNVS